MRLWPFKASVAEWETRQDPKNLYSGGHTLNWCKMNI